MVVRRQRVEDTGRQLVDLNNLAQNRAKCRAVVNHLMNSPVQNVWGIFCLVEKVAHVLCVVIPVQ